MFQTAKMAIMQIIKSALHAILLAQPALEELLLNAKDAMMVIC